MKPLTYLCTLYKGIQLLKSEIFFMDFDSQFITNFWNRPLHLVGKFLYLVTVNCGIRASTRKAEKLTSGLPLALEILCNSSTDTQQKITFGILPIYVL